MNIRCPHCQTLFRVDPARVPARGIRAKCARCGGTFQIAGSAAPGAEAPARRPHEEERAHAPVAAPAAPSRPAEAAARPAAAGAATATARSGGQPAFGSRDPNTRAQRIARALVSDIVAYHPDRRDDALGAGTLRAEFRDEIMKSWEEYVAQVGQDLAKSTPYFRQALNDILARGQNVF